MKKTNISSICIWIVAIWALALIAVVSNANATGPVITSFHGNGELTWDSAAGSTYRVEWSPDLLSGTWYRDWWDLKYITSSGTETTALVPMFYRVVEDSSTYDKSTLTGVWIISSPDVTLYIVGDGAGTITEIGSFNPGTPPGLYDVFPDGSFCSIIIEANDPDVGIIGQFLSSVHATIEQPIPAGLDKVTDLSLCQGVWSGTLTETSPGTAVKIVTLTVDSSGVITGASGLAAPVTGKMYALSDGTLTAFIKTGETGHFNQISLAGLLSGNSTTGTMFLDADNGEGTFSLAR